MSGFGDELACSPAMQSAMLLASRSPQGVLLLAWENRNMPLRDTLRSYRFKATGIIFLVVTLAVFTFMAPPHEVVLHNVLHHMNILPFMLAGMWFGWRGALKVVLLACVLQAPSIARHWHRAKIDSQDQIVELSTFGAAGMIAGVLAERERMQRRHVESTKRELEQVYGELRHSIEHLKQSERLSAAGQLSASLAHEIRNPLASIRGAAGILARGQASDEARRECLDILMQESQRLNKLLTNFLEFARPRSPRMHTTRPEELIRGVVALTQHAAHRDDVAIEVVVSSEMLPEIECDPEQINQLLLNLLLNALQSMDSAGKVVIRLMERQGVVQIDVMDEGRGIPVEQLHRVFDPFFTTRETGTGLGLAIAAKIASQHGGSLTCRANHTRGMVFRFEMPSKHSAAVIA
jgi:two-component system, NtrC family, sensor histidine kinase HydH